jgi:hypothetical protein
MRRQFLAHRLAGWRAADRRRATLIDGGFTGIALSAAIAAPRFIAPRHTADCRGRRGRAGGGACAAPGGVDDFALLELEDSAGGNSRGGQVNGMACPLGAHYLPVPGDDAPEVQDLLEELGLRQRVAGRWQYDERHLCHSPQERLFFKGEWQEGLLPVQGVGAATLAQYQRFAELVAQLQARRRALRCRCQGAGFCAASKRWTLLLS